VRATRGFSCPLTPELALKRLGASCEADGCSVRSSKPNAMSTHGRTGAVVGVVTGTCGRTGCGTREAHHISDHAHSDSQQRLRAKVK